MRLPATGTSTETSTGKTAIPRLFWLFAAALVIYGLAETMFGNWGTTLLTGRGVKPDSADGALLLAPAARSAGAGIALFALGGLACLVAVLVVPMAVLAAAIARRQGRP